MIQRSSAIALILIYICLVSCQSEIEKSFENISGKTMGTTYSIVYDPSNSVLLKREIDSILLEINSSINTYDPSSLISRFNADSIQEMVVDSHFLNIYRASVDVYEKSDGAFDPTVMPLVNYWGFGYTDKKPVTTVDSVKIDSIMRWVGLDKMVLSNDQDRFSISKMDMASELDFSGIAKGYASDVIANYAKGKGVEKILIEIGGDGLAVGQAEGLRPWRFGINEPLENAALNAFYQVIQISDRAIATSGNYRNFYETENMKYGHTIHPKTGFPERSNLLSTTIISPTAMTSDAYATACMVKGLESSLTWIETLKDIEAYFIYIGENSTLQAKFTTGFTNYLSAE